MALIRFPVVSTWITSMRKDKSRIFRLLVIVGLVIAFVYFDHTQRGRTNPEVSDWLYSRDPILKLVHGINKSMRESPESVIYVATGILFAQYLMYISLMIKYVGKGNLILVEVFTGWLIGVLIKLLRPLPRSSLAIDYAHDLSYPLQKYADDISFSTSTFMAMVCARRLVDSKQDYLGKFILWAVVVSVVFFLFITYNTDMDAVAWAILVNIGVDRFRSWLAVKMRKKASSSLRAIFTVMQTEASQSVTNMKRQASGAWKQVRRGLSSRASEITDRNRSTELDDLDVVFEPTSKRRGSESGSVVYDPNAVDDDDDDDRGYGEKKGERAHAVTSRAEEEDDQMELHSVHSDDIRSLHDEQHTELLDSTGSQQLHEEQ